MNTVNDKVSDWPERDLVIKVHALLGKATISGNPDFDRRDDPELYDAIEGQSLGSRAILGEDLRLALQWGGA